MSAVFSLRDCLFSERWSHGTVCRSQKSQCFIYGISKQHQLHYYKQWVMHITQVSPGIFCLEAQRWICFSTVLCLKHTYMSMYTVTEVSIIILWILSTNFDLLNVKQEQMHITNAMGLMKKRRKYGVKSPMLSRGSFLMCLKPSLWKNGRIHWQHTTAAVSL